MELTQQVALGCANGYHQFSADDAVLKPDGDLTTLVSKCTSCNQFYEISAALNLNDIIRQADDGVAAASRSQEPVRTAPVAPAPTYAQPVDSDDEILRKIFGR